ncbi:CBS domain-containing protein [Flaviaesturariibacter aridisoli]|uniref:CBS domain-containing protein n=1 Tax=Flaviaesturariibacter aridisoli TaxID=2545761 RepID=A0A4R4DY60_9BACT|nr:CBS domain-containing protein [Flaviaesturariibacter aridisoli]TCZ70156.1 CBS domain-containing protein [Flaviaesturariibacter aridisoli]
MRTVAQLLTTKPPLFNQIGPNALVLEALNLLNSLNLSYLVVTEDGQYRGLFSERDYARNVILKGHASNSTPVREVMSVDLPIVNVEETIEQCMRLMNAHKTRYLLAYDDEQFVGVVTIHDLLREVINNRELVFDRATVSALVDQQEEGIF